LAANNFSVGILRDNNNNNNDDGDGDNGRLDQTTRYATNGIANPYNYSRAAQKLQMQLHPAFAAYSRRSFHTTPSVERGPALVLGLATVSALAYAGSSALTSFNEWKDSQPTKEELEQMRKQEEKEQAKMKAQQEEEANEKKKQESVSGSTSDDQPRTNIFREWFDVGTKYYEGGFEDTMTRREAALILGVRESSSPRRVKDAHRKLLILNHPDTGGSTFLSLKVNEAKELLLKGKSTKKKK